MILYPTDWEREELSFLENSAVLLIASGELQDNSTINSKPKWKVKYVHENKSD